MTTPMKNACLLCRRTAIIVVVIGVLLGSITVSLFRQVCTREKKENCYRDLLAFSFRVEQNIPDNAVVFIGDSLIQGLCVAAVTPYAVNLGIGRDTTAGVLQRISRYSELKRAGAVVLLVGVNDVIQGHRQGIVDRYKTILQMIPDTVTMVLCALLPVDERVTTKVQNRDIVSINAAMKAACMHKGNCRYFDSTEKLIDFSGNLKAQYHIGDGIHLNRQGYEIWIAGMKLFLSDFAP